MSTACGNTNDKKCVGHSDSKPVKQQQQHAGAAQPPRTCTAADQEAVDIANSRHVCGGKGSICEFLRSQPSRSDNKAVDGATASRSPGATTTTTFWDVAREVINSKQTAGAAAKDAGGVCEPHRPKPVPAAPGCGGVAGPVTVEHVAIVINIAGPAARDKHRPASESCGRPEQPDEEPACECVQPSRGAARAGNRTGCECFAATGRPQPPRDQEQRAANKPCLRRRRHSNASVASQTAVQHPGAKSIRNVERPEPPAIGAQHHLHQSNRNTMSCKCRCHLH